MAPKKKSSPDPATSPEDRPTGRLTAEEKAEILRQVDRNRSQTAVARQYRLSQATISR